jgi:hypothetical protein
MRLFTRLAKKVESYAAAEGVRMSKPFPRKLNLLAWAVGVILVILLAEWMAHHP